MMDGFRTVFYQPVYVFLAGIVALIVFAFAVLLPNIPLLVQILPDQNIAFGTKLQLVVGLVGSIQTNFTFVSATYTILIAILFGVNIALFAYFIRKQKTTLNRSSSAAGVGGLVSGFFGIGCAACGTFILTWVLGLVGAVGILSYLPLGGEEFGILGVVLLLFAVGTTAKKITAPQVCE